MKIFKQLFKLMFRLLEWMALICMVIMVVVVFVEVVKRYVFSQGFPWSQEIATLMMVWFGFLGVAIGVLERIHMSIELFTRRLPARAVRAIESVVYILIALFGVLMIVYGIQIMQVTARSTLPATKWPSAVVYIILPLSGFLVTLNALFCTFGWDATLLRFLGGHHRSDDIQKEDDACPI